MPKTSGIGMSGGVLGRRCCGYGCNLSRDRTRSDCMCVRLGRRGQHLLGQLPPLMRLINKKAVVALILGSVLFGCLMGLRQGVSSFTSRALIAGVAGAVLSAALWVARGKQNKSN